MAGAALRLDICPVRAVTPCIAVHQAASVVDFAKRAFDAQELCRRVVPSGALFCEVKIGDSVVMIGGGLQWRGNPRPATLHLYLDDVDSSFARAIAVGGKELQVPVDRDYGSRAAGIVDAGETIGIFQRCCLRAGILLSSFPKTDTRWRHACIQRTAHG